MIIWTYRYLRRKFSKSKDSTGTAAESTPSSKPEKPKRKTSPEEWKFLAKLTLSLAVPIFLETLDYTETPQLVVATAQTNIASAFDRLDLQSYIGTLYLLTSTVFLPLFASVADIYGRHFAMQSSLVFFIFGSALSTGAKNMEMMLAGRAIAGIGAAGLLTVVRVILSDSGSLSTINWQIAILFLLYSIGYSVGPVIGGYLGHISFRWIFAINLPACVVSMLLLFFLLRKHLKKGFVLESELLAGQAHPSFTTKFLKVDWIGAFFFIAGAILILLGLNWGSTEKWNSPKVIICFVIGGILILPCAIWEYVLEKQKDRVTPSSKARASVLSAYPMIPLEIFRNYDVVTVQAASFAGGMVMIVMFYFVAIFMTIVNGLDQRQAGIQLIYFAPGSGVGTFIALRMTSILRQPKYAIIIGSLIIPISLGLISLGVQQGKQVLVNVFLALSGVGVGMNIGTLNIHARFSQPEERVAIVSALMLFFRSFGGMLGLAQCGAVLNTRARSYIARAVAEGRFSSNITSGAGLQFTGRLGSVGQIAELPEDVQVVIREAFRDGVRWCFISLVPWAAIAFVLTVFLSDIPDADKRKRREEESEKPAEARDEVQEIPRDYKENEKGEVEAQAEMRLS
ncbi:hypothetical protein AAF712_004256 [Marasmius tenuissimus]|uniref:Major facilitator superfamily (MFS) profile domain-containing protein n=1 Tax=Marasmius tenuissimus TaxID=585030 RepID=A0ABR3A561_9AGAR